MKIVNLVLAVMFLLFSFVQINDPDPVVWILIYGAMAVVCVLAAFRHFYPWVMIGMLVVYFTYSLWSLPSITRWLRSDDKAMLFDNVAKMQNLYIEESREYLGLVICMLVLIMNLVVARMKRAL
jgi:Ca2+/Na+ antiporter